MAIGYFLSRSVHPEGTRRPSQACRGCGLRCAVDLDHFHPWNDEQGQSAFVWGVIGAPSEATSLPVSTAVTCPTVRIHPAIIAQAAATAAVQLDGRFVLGVGSGEALNEHILGDPWPSVGSRQEMLEEAVEVIRLLLRGDEVSHHGVHYEVQEARIYTRPDQPVPIYVSIRAAGRQAEPFLPYRWRAGHPGTRPGADLPVIRWWTNRQALHQGVLGHRCRRRDRHGAPDLG